MTYDNIINNYVFVNEEIDLYVLESALEEDITSNSSDTMNRVSLLQKIRDKITQIINHINSFISDRWLYISNALQKCYLTDKGFQKQLREAELKYEPLKGIEIISYDYDLNYLNSALNTFDTVFKESLSEAKQILTSINKDNSKLLLSKKEYDAYVLSRISSSTSIDNMSLYLSEVKKKFRNGKVKRTVLAKEIPEHMRVVDSYKSIKTDLESSKRAFFENLKILKTSSNSILSHQNLSEHDQQKITKVITNISSMYNLYSSFISMYFELMVERMLASRIILKKLYQI